MEVPVGGLQLPWQYKYKFLKVVCKMNSDTSLRSVSASLSVKNETKEKFEALLNSAISKRDKSEQSKSKEHLLNETELEMESSSSNNKSFILNKFLGNNASEVVPVKQTREDDEMTFIKPPIPKPRRKKQPSPTSSEKTFEVNSPKIVKINSNNASVTSNKTYNVEEIGDVLIHDRQKSKSGSNSNQSSIVEKGETEILSDSERQNNAKIFDKSKVDHVNEIIEMDDLQQQDNNGIAPKPRSIKKEKSKKEDEITQTAYKYEKIIEIIIHKTDRLQLNSMVVHPVVKVHVVDIETGDYIRKSDRNRSVVFFYENADCDYISPVMTHAFNLQEKRTLYPSWEETILLNEDYNYIVEEKSRIILFFEVLDFVSFSMAKDSINNNKGWHKIAFAFLKVSGKGDLLNIGKKVKLQLYWYPHHRNAKKQDSRTCQVWSSWKTRNLKKYPSGLHVTVKSVISPTKICEVFRSKTPIQAEISRNQMSFDANHRNITTTGLLDVEKTGSCTSTGGKKDIAWSRHAYEICKLPNKCVVKFSSYDEGCFVLKFSNDGRHLGCAVLKNDLYCVVLYSIVNLQEIFSFPCHQGLIYDIVWSSDDVLLLTASADNTISIFNVQTHSFIQILPHPSFVYSVSICNEKKVVASGCYDGTVRIWRNDDEKFHLFQELEGHSGYVTSLCFSKTNVLYSADSVGKIIEWNENDKHDDWKLNREIELLDLKNTVINKILLFPKNTRILVHSRDSTIRIVDLKTTCVIQWFQGALNRRVHISCTLSACGTYVLSGSEDGLVHVWNVKSGQNIATYAPHSRFNSQIRTIHCVEFHPFDNVLAVSHYGDILPILLLAHDSDCKEVLFNMNNNANGGSECNVHEDKKIDVINQFERNKGYKSVCRGEGDENKIDFKSIIRKMDAVMAFQGPNDLGNNL